jgi:hypothetical protein
MCETHRLLRPGGAHLIVSFRARPFFERLLAAPPLACTLSVHPIPHAADPGGPPHHDDPGGSGRPGDDGDGGGGGNGAHAYLLRRGACAPRSFDTAAAAAVRAHMDGVVKVQRPKEGARGGVRG